MKIFITSMILLGLLGCTEQSQSPNQTSSSETLPVTSPSTPPTTGAPASNTSSSTTPPTSNLPANTLTKETLESVIAKRVLAWGDSKPIAWDRALLTAILNYPLSEKVKSQCGKTQDVKLCWAKLISKMSYHESKWNPEEKYEECSSKKGTYSNATYVASKKKYCMMSKGEIVTSRGLLQISYDSALGYGCKLTKSSDLHNPETNLTCAVLIHGAAANKHLTLMAEEKKGCAAYWSVCRKYKNGTVKESWQLITNYLKAN